eukprot:5499644-Pyramimonas_sp.AAC.1
MVQNIAPQFPIAVDFSTQLYTTLAQMTDGEASDIVKNTLADHGLETWRKLCRRFDPHTGQ